MHEEAHDMCRGEGEGCGGGSIDEEYHGEMGKGGGVGGGVSMDEIAPESCGGEGGGGGILMEMHLLT